MVDRRTFNISISAVAAAATLGGVGAAFAKPKTKGTFPVSKTPAEWREFLTPEQYYVLREHGTERAFSSPLDKTYSDGIYRCAGCGQALFTSKTKFDSGTGWPSFYQPIEGAVGQSVDKSFFMTRTEIHCANCGGHLGHVFNDGPRPTGLRYCMNGVALEFVAEDDAKMAETNDS